MAKSKTLTSTILVTLRLILKLWAKGFISSISETDETSSKEESQK